MLRHSALETLYKVGKYSTHEKHSLKFKEILGSELPNNLVFSCGSGVTACVLALAYSLVNNTYSPTIYDGSWAEYGKI